MPSRGLFWTSGIVLHVLNRAARRLRLFEAPDDYRAFLKVVGQGCQRTGVRILAYCVMPNHYHLVVWPTENGQLVEFMWWFQGTHAKRWHRARTSQGTGAVYQGRYKAFPVQQESYFTSLCRYVERNALRAGLVKRAEEWPWSSLAQRCAGRNSDLVTLSSWPIPPSPDWVDLVNQVEPARDIADLRRAVRRNIPFGDEAWREATVKELRLRPQKRRASF